LGGIIGAEILTDGELNKPRNVFSKAGHRWTTELKPS
jgi:hypothetical protein